LYLASVEGPINDSHDPNRWILRTLLWWYGVQAWTFTASNGSAVEITLSVDDRGRLSDPTSMKIPAFWTWAYKNGLQEAAKAYLDGLGAARVEEATRPDSARSLENTGTCPCCFANVKLTGGTIMRHGWQVQGSREWGQYGSSWHSAACWGFHYLPFEISKAGTEDYLENAVKPSLANAERRLAELRAMPAVLAFRNRAKSLVEIQRPEGFVLDRNYYPTESYGDILLRQLRATTGDIKGMQDLQRTLEAKIQAWTPQPLPGTR
jgi:hypothetical protein